jgi:hypothetical protein
MRDHSSIWVSETVDRSRSEAMGRRGNRGRGRQERRERAERRDDRLDDLGPDGRRGPPASGRARRPGFGRRGRRYGPDGRGGGGGGGILLAIVLVAAIGFALWYFVLRDDGSSDGAPTITPTVSVTSSAESET